MLIVIASLIVMLFLIKLFIPLSEIDFNIVYPLFFLIIGICALVKEKKINIWSISLSLIGIWYLLLNLNILKEDYELIFWGTILIVLITKSIIFYLKSIQNKNSDKLNYLLFFENFKEKIINNNFKVVNIYTIFAITQLNFSKIKINEDITINIKSIMGKTSVKLPDNKYTIKVSTRSLFGKSINKNKSKQAINKNTIYVKSISIFGKTCIK